MSLTMVDVFPMQALCMMMENEKGETQLFLRAFEGEYCIIFQCNITGETARRLGQEETDKYDPIFQRELRKFVQQKAEERSIDYDSFRQAIKEALA